MCGLNAVTPKRCACSWLYISTVNNRLLIQLRNASCENSEHGFSFWVVLWVSETKPIIAVSDVPASCTLGKLEKLNCSLFLSLIYQKVTLNKMMSIVFKRFVRFSFFFLHFYTFFVYILNRSRAIKDGHPFLHANLLNHLEEPKLEKSRD